MFSSPPPGPLTRLRLCCNAALSAVLRATGSRHFQLVVCGFPRSGTSLLYNMLSSCLPGFRYEPFENYYIYRIHRVGNYASKAPLDILHLSQIDALNINRKRLVVLILIRDVRDVLTSRHPMLPNTYFIGHDHSWWPQNRQFTDWKYDAPGIMPIYKGIQDVRERPDTALIRYEDLVQDPNAVQAFLQDKYALRFACRFSEFHTRPDKHAYRYDRNHPAIDADQLMENAPSTRDKVARWRSSQEDVRRVIEQFEACDALFDILEDFGYEKDRSWFTQLTLASQEA